jgi:hypothetical protein
MEAKINYIIKQKHRNYKKILIAAGSKYDIIADFQN